MLPETKTGGARLGLKFPSETNRLKGGRPLRWVAGTWRYFLIIVSRNIKKMLLVTHPKDTFLPRSSGYINIYI